MGIYLGVCIYVSMSLFLTNEGQNLVLVINFSALLHDTYSELIKEETLIICENFMTKKPSYWIQGYSNWRWQKMKLELEVSYRSGINIMGVWFWLGM